MSPKDSNSPKQVPKSIYEKYEKLGCNRMLISEAYQTCPNPENENLMLDYIMNIQKENEIVFNDQTSKNVAPVGGMQDDDMEVNKAILESIKTAQEQNVFVETLNPIDRKRKVGNPAGLKNIGNTCYFNSLLQTYFMYPDFVKEILEFKEPNNLSIDDSNAEKARILGSIKLVKALQNLFGMMIFSKKKYVDPSQVLNSMVDDYGKIIPIGDQKDIGEFNLNFLARIEEALLQQDSHKSMMQIEEDKQESSLEAKISNSSKNEKISLGSGIKDSGDKLLQKKFIMTNDHHLVFKLFFGKTMRYMSYNDQEKHSQQTEEEPFNMIILDLKFKDLYSSWEESLFEKIDDYKNNMGEITPAEKSSFIKSPPGTLFFQLQRVVFDKDKGIKKINDKFIFEKEIFIDRALDENKAHFLKVREKVQKLKEIVKSYEEAIRQIKNYNNSEINLLSILSQSTNFLLNQKEKPIDLEGNIELIKPTYFGMDDENQLNSCVQILEKYKSTLEKKMIGFEKSLNELNQEIEDSYSGLKKIRYKLLSILIHEGSAEYGHYYSYICDFQQNIWRKYNDTHILEVKEDELLKEAIGGVNNINAYCLIYVNEDLASRFDKNLPLRDYSSFDEGKINDYYTHLLAESTTFKEIGNDNMKFLQEVEEYTIRNQIKTIFEDYQREFQYINEVERKLKDKIEKSDNKKKINLNPTLNFCIFLRFHKNNKDKKLENLVNWQILNHCLVMACPELKSLENFHNFPPLWQDKLKEQLKKLNTLNKYKGVELDINKQEYMDLMNEYIDLTCYISISTYFLKKAVEGNVKDSLFAAIHIKKTIQNSQNSFFIRFNSEFFKIIVSYLSSSLHENLKIELLDEFKDNLNLIDFLLSHHINDTEFCLQVRVWLSELPTLFEKYTHNEAFINFANLSLKILGKNQMSMEELNILEPKDFSMMLNQNAIENEPQKIDSFKEVDSLNENFLINFNSFKAKYDKWCQSINVINQHFKTSNLPLMKKELEELGIF